MCVHVCISDENGSAREREPTFCRRRRGDGKRAQEKNEGN